ncbi:VOC family protein [Edaphobacter bradus]|uniref:VOC family protein n=1 Tax=Edaphobacter bradus TaxID=2259016 RepID=UPI0021DF87C6|nr:VOC family protein [Edaphobacter bradus]
MLSTCDVMGFIPTTDRTRARGFYLGTLKLNFESDDGFALVVNANGTSIRIVAMEKFTPAPYTILGWKVPDIARAVTELSTAGVSFLRYSFLQQDASGVWSAPGGAKVAWFHDPDGNVLSISQF